MAIVLITGGTGELGSELVERFPAGDAGPYADRRLPATVRARAFAGTRSEGTQVPADRDRRGGRPNGRGRSERADRKTAGHRRARNSYFRRDGEGVAAGPRSAAA